MNFTVSTELEIIICPACAGTYAIVEVYKEEAKRLGKFLKCWTCPYCKTERGFGESEAERLRKEIAAQQRELTNVKCSLLAEREVRAGAERSVKRITKRIHAGVCPCCNRMFTNLARHMKTKHPEQVPSTTIAK